MEVAVASHAIGGLVFFISTLVLLKHSITRIQAPGLIFGCLFTSIWSFLAALYSAQLLYHYQIVALSEIVRNISWVICVINLIQITQQQAFNAKLLYRGLKVSFCLLGFGMMVMALLIKSRWEPGSSGIYAKYTFIGNVIFAVATLALIEQLYRGNVPERRWGLKFFCLGLFCLYSYDLFMYADGFLFKDVDPSIWQIRGACTALMAPLILITALRHAKWQTNLQPSRRVILHSTVIFACGIYLIFTGTAGFYIKKYGGTLGGALQVFFIFATIVFLGALFVSGRCRSFVSLFLAKHFFKFRYDYRYEWGKLTKLLTDRKDYLSLEQRVIKAIAELVQSPKGVLYQMDSNNLHLTAGWNVSMEKIAKIINFSEIDFLIKKPDPTILNIKNYASPVYGWWLAVPLVYNEKLTGVIFLKESRTVNNINWEVFDFLSLASLQVAINLAQAKDAKALAIVEKFEAVNQISAFVIHDIKNVISQLNFIQSNKEKFDDNPDFVASVYKTTASAASKLEKLLSQVQLAQKKELPNLFLENVSLQKILIEVLQITKNLNPLLKIEGFDLAQNKIIKCDFEALLNALVHLVTNAQQATSDSGSVTLTIIDKKSAIELILTDTGCGMDESFIQKGLFEPFVSSKGPESMGIGVYQAKTNILKIGGMIQVSSKKDHGTTFVITLPVSVTVNSKQESLI